MVEPNATPNSDLTRSFSLPAYRDTPPLELLIREQNERFYSTSPASSAPSSPTTQTSPEMQLPPLPLITPGTNTRELQAFYDREAAARKVAGKLWRSVSVDGEVGAARRHGLARSNPPICVLRQERGDGGVGAGKPEEKEDEKHGGSG